MSLQLGCNQDEKSSISYSKNEKTKKNIHQILLDKFEINIDKVNKCPNCYVDLLVPAYKKYHNCKAFGGPINKIKF